MSQSSTKQTRLDHFYKVTSYKNTGCGIKLINKKLNRRVTSEYKHSIATNVGKSTIKSAKMFSFVQSEVEIVKDYTAPLKSLKQSNQSPKRNLLLESESPLKKQKINHPLSPSDNNIDSNKKILGLESPKGTNSPEKKLNYTPKKASNGDSPLLKKFSPRKLCFDDTINIKNVQLAIENLNLTRQNSIVPNEFDLETIYKNSKFSYVYSDDLIVNQEKFELKDIIFPKEKHADNHLMIIMNVFCNPVNCGYFSKEELNLIFLLITLSAESQMLFVRLLKRKLGWHRTSSIKYPEVSNNLDCFFEELVQNGFCTSDLSSIDIPVLINMLQVDEVRNLCQKLKIDHRGNKPAMITKLLKYGNSVKSYFLGAKSPKSILRSMVLSTLQPCVSLVQEVISLFDRVFTLLCPVQDPTESIADLFLMLSNIHKGETIFPPVPKDEPFPIFKNRVHLIHFVESKNIYKNILTAIERKEWDEVRNLGLLAFEQLSNDLKKEQQSSLPLHVKKFVPQYMWMKVLSKSIDAFKKKPETISEAVKILKYLIDEKQLSQSSRGRWYNELALIEMHHRKDLESSAALTLHALQQDTLSEVDISGLMERLKKLIRRKTGISKETKTLILKAQEEIEKKGLAVKSTITKTITANMASRIQSGGKSKWIVDTNGKDKYYGAVEVLALSHYTCEEDFLEGLHCEGSLPITLFTVLFWDELYNIFVPGAFVSAYQNAPLDLFTAEFFKNRKNKIEDKIKFVRALDLESFSEWMQERYSSYCHYKSVMTDSLFKSEQQFKDVVSCLGIIGVTGICERLVSNFRLWRSGFPDLIVWNISIPKCKIVEVKGPGDSLSEKQKLWLQYLERLGIEVEVCYVEATTRGSK